MPKYTPGEEYNDSISAKILRWTIIINLPLSLATLALAVYTYSIALSTYKMKEASEEANKLTKGNFKNQMRAYVVQTAHMRVERTSSGNSINNFNIEQEIKNVGQSPASDVVEDIKFYILPTGTQNMILDFRDDASSCADINATARGTIGSGQEIYYALNRYQIVADAKKENSYDLSQVSKFDDRILSAWESGNAYAMIQGISCYNDIFGEKHFSKICRYFRNQQEFENMTVSDCKSGNEIN